MSKTIIFFGNERLATGVSTTCPALRALLADGYDVAAVVVAQNESGRSRKARGLEIAELAKEHGIPVLSPSDLSGSKDQLLAYGARAAVLIAYGKIVPPDILGIFPGGIINVHPSLLPLHRGSTPIESVILEGADETGVSLMKLSQKMDAGPVYAQIRLPLSGQESKQELADRSADIGVELLLKHLPEVLSSGTAAFHLSEQDEAAATYDEHISKADGYMDWTKPAARLEREVRAYAGWPRSRAKLGGVDAVITRAASVKEDSHEPGAVETTDKRLLVGTSEGSLEVLSLIPAGRREMNAEAFLAGYKL